MAGKFVKLNQAAFISMVSSCLETYKKESYGVLLVLSFNGTSLVRNSVNYQTATRTYDYVDVDSHRERKMKKALKYLSNHKMIGDFHSHSDFPDKLSRHDRKDLLAQGNKWVSILLVIWDTRKKTPWAYNKKDKYLSGSVSNRFFVKMHAYKNIDGKIEKVRIDCPYVNKLNEAHF